MSYRTRHITAMFIKYYIGFITYGYDSKFDFIENGGDTILLGELLNPSN